MRKPPNLHEKLAAALLQLHPDMREWAKGKTPKQIIGMFQCHHVVYVATAASNHPTNLHMMLTDEHIERTRKIDVPAIAKGKRIEKATAAHKEVMAEKSEFPYVWVNAAWGKGLFHKTVWPKGRKLQSRGFQKKEKGTA